MYYTSLTQSNYAQNGKLILAFTTLFFFLLLLSIFLHAFRHTCFPRRRHNRHRLPSNSSPGPILAFDKDLHPSFLASLPTYSSSSAAAASDNCAVCMSEFAAGDERRTLPNCRHVSHSNCPLCRTTVHLPAPSSMPEKAKLSSESLSSFPGAVWCPRKPLELEEDKLTKSFCINITVMPHM